MATNVSEKDRILRALDEYVNNLDLVEFQHLLRQIMRGRSAPVDADLEPRDDGLIIQRLRSFDADTGAFRRESFTVYGPTSGFTIDDPTPEEKALLYTYAGYRHALAKIHRWAMANLGYSGDMPSEVPNQSEGADE